jgi:mTERF domain-containing protein, mitochondrial
MKVDFLIRQSLGCSEAEVNIAVFKLPYIMNLTEINLSPTIKFLKMEVGLESSYIVYRLTMLCSLQ